MWLKAKRIGGETHSCSVVVDKRISWYLGQHKPNSIDSIYESFKENILDVDRIEIQTNIENGFKYAKVRCPKGKLIARSKSYCCESDLKELINNTINYIKNPSK